MKINKLQDDKHLLYEEQWEGESGKITINVTQIKSFYPLGTTDGLNYTIVPRA